MAQNSEMPQVREYLGFDLGDGESAVAWASAQGVTPPLMLEIAGRKNVLTALGERENGDAWIGENAYMADAKQLFVRFKSRYLNEPAEVGPLLQRFAHQVFLEIRRQGKLEDPDAAAVFVGCPSGWKEDTRAGYGALFEKAGFRNVEVVSESRAAFMFVRESGEVRAPEETLARPTLIIDAGSSTTDFTFVNRLKALEVFDFGENHLGGGLIDRMVLDRAVAQHPQRERVERVFTACPQYRARCELEARKVKEMYFTRAAQQRENRFDVPCESSVKIYYDRPPITLDIALTPADMKAILGQSAPELNGDGYLTAYRKSLENARRALGGVAPEIILLTGGASRMPFMRAMAVEAFPEAEMLTGAEPEFSIARGLCYALRIDRRTAVFEAGVKDMIASSAVETIVDGRMDALYRAVAPVVAQGLIERCAPAAFRMWRRGEVKTIGDMTQAICGMLSASLDSGELKGAIEPVTRAWLEGVRPELERLTDPICASAHLPLTSLRLPGVSQMDAAGLNIDAEQVMDISLFQTVVDVVVATIVAGLLGGGGVALMMAGPVGFIVSFAIGFVASRLGTTFAVKHIDKANIPSFLRLLFSERLFAQTLEKRRDELTHSIESQLKAAAGERGGASDALKENIALAIEGQLSGMAEQARLLIH